MTNTPQHGIRTEEVVCSRCKAPAIYKIVDVHDQIIYVSCAECSEEAEDILRIFYDGQQQDGA